LSSGSANGFVLVLAVGGAALALWIVAAFPHRGPRDLGRALIHVLVSVLGGAGIAPGIRGLTALGIPAAAYVGTFLIALPGLTYMFLAAAWMMRVLRDHLQGARP
jgi:hypothetical protein